MVSFNKFDNMTDFLKAFLSSFSMTADGSVTIMYESLSVAVVNTPAIVTLFGLSIIELYGANRSKRECCVLLLD